MASRFGFIIHPLSLEDVGRFEPKAKGKSPKLIEKILEWTPAFKLSEVEGVVSKTGKPLSGCLIACAILPKDVLHGDRKKVLEKIIEAGRVAEEERCQVVGLGAYTSVAADAGITVADVLEIGVTTGTSFTVGSALMAMEKLAALRHRDLKSEVVAVVGATGAIGSCLTTLLAERAGELVLIARNRRKLQARAEELNPKTSITYGDNLAELLPRAGMVFTATSTPFAIVQPEHLKRGALVVDISTPRNVHESVALARPDVVVVEGGAIAIPGSPNFHFDFGQAPGTSFACMSETMILALEEHKSDYSLGRIVEPEKVRAISTLAVKHGFELAAFRAFGKTLDLSLPLPR